MITPGQCRAARALLSVSQKQLADSAGISLRTLQGFEAGERDLQSLALSAIERFLAEQGIRLINDSNWSGVKLALHAKPASS